MTRSRFLRLLPAVCLAAAALAPAAVTALGIGDDAEHPAIQYSTTAPADAVSKLRQRVERGEVKLARDPVRGYLPAVLKQLGIPVSSQSLVFSKTSLQRERISASTPRALYYNDDTYVGWVQGGPILEITSIDPQLGAVFYTVDQDAQKPVFIRQTHECLSCHGSTFTRGIPGLMVRSVFADRAGQPHFSAGTYLTTDESPWEQRWGGWYVTGTHGEERHMGNLITHSAAQANNPNLNSGANVTRLDRFFNTKPYLTPHSDLAALVVLQHQAHLHNLITRANYETRMALHYEQALNKELNRGADYRSDSTLSRVKSVGEPLVRGLLFSKEAPFQGPAAGTTSFAREFVARGPRDKQGRSLRELDLRKRLFRYPCSFLIYSEQFDGLPALAKEYVYRRLWEVLSGKDTTPQFAHLTPEDRQAITEILLETKPEFAAAKPD
jgi:hypothetical protein